MKLGRYEFRRMDAAQRRRLLLLAASGAIALAFEFGLRAWDGHQRTDKELRATESRIALLRQSADLVDWEQRSAALAVRQEALREQLWRAPSEAQAQGLLRDWLQAQLKASGIDRGQLRLLPLQAARPASAASSAEMGLEAELQQALRVRAQISFDLQQGRLETLLDHIENGGQLAQVDSLSASRRTRRVELVVSLPVLVRDRQQAEAQR